MEYVPMVRVKQWKLQNGTNNHVYTLVVDGTDVYLGGAFTTAGGENANYIAKWNGSSWLSLGSGMNDAVYALAVDSSGNLYAGGEFTTAGGVSANRIAMWNGSSWSSLGSGLNDTVRAIAVDGSGNVYAGGAFSSAGGVGANSIAKWDGGSWSSLGSGMNNTVHAIAVQSSNVYAGGEFTTAGGVSANRIAMWDGGNWSALGTGMDNTVYAIAAVSGDLYAGGLFITAGGVTVNRIATWNGSSWSALGSGTDGKVSAVVPGSGNVYIGGDFTIAGGVDVNNLANWTGSSWSSLDVGVNDGVRTLAIDDGGNVFAGGHFTMTRDVSANYVALWNGSGWSPLSDGTTWTTYCVGCPYVDPPTYTFSPEQIQIESMATARPGMIWVIGNEIERIDWPGGRQDEITPELYAVAYHDIYNMIKNADPTAQVAIGGVIQATPLRLEYLTKVWDTYSSTYGESMPVDVWNVHAFVLREESGSWGADIPAGSSATSGMLYDVLDNKDFTIVEQHLEDMRTWMKDRGQQDKSLIITEYGVLMPDWVSPGEFTPEEVRDSFMYPSFDYFLNQTDTNLGYSSDGYRLVQRWNWYSLDDDSGKYEGEEYLQNFNGNLFYSGLSDQPQGLSGLGDIWIQYVQSLPPETSSPYSLLMVSDGGLPSTLNAGAAIQGQGVLSTTCEDGRLIQLIFVDPSPPGHSIGLDANPTPPPIVRITGTCLQRSSD
jgi:hypothetical protein